MAGGAAFLRGIWGKGAEDDALFLAGGVAFNILLAGVPFFLLLASGIGYAMNKSPTASSGAVSDFIQNLFPSAWSGDGSLLDPVLDDVVRTRGKAGAFGAVAFVWFSTRLFGSMRTVLTRTMDVPRSHGIVVGKLFDIVLTVAATALIVVWVALSAYIALARSSSVALLSDMGLHAETLMRPVTYVVARIVAFALIVAIFFALYKVLPNRRVRWQQAALGGATSAVLFELARNVFTWVVHRWNPASLYSGTLSAIIVVVFWVYYAALIFVLGGEVSQVHERWRRSREEAAA
ncbi:MAG: YihY/virulence factor BrkB family protein [Gemmatimonadales bacterium]